MKNRPAVLAILAVGTVTTIGFVLAVLETRGHSVGGAVLAAAGGMVLTIVAVALTQVEP